jgi:hypothetical protein
MNHTNKSNKTIGDQTNHNTIQAVRRTRNCCHNNFLLLSPQDNEWSTHCRDHKSSSDLLQSSFNPRFKTQDFKRNHLQSFPFCQCMWEDKTNILDYSADVLQHPCPYRTSWGGGNYFKCSRMFTPFFPAESLFIHNCFCSAITNCGLHQEESRIFHLNFVVQSENMSLNSFPRKNKRSTQ